jgi:GR25 family glycosyltransferase involved in LPS biosynthesis
MDLICVKQISNEDIKKLNGTYIDEKFIKYEIVKNDCDCYTDEGELLFKFRKNVVPNSSEYIETFKDLASWSRGRGASAGPIDPDRVYWKKRTLAKTKGYSTHYMNDDKISKMKVNNPVYSNPIGFYEPSKSFGNKPCRLTRFTMDNFENFLEGMPYLKAIADSYKNLVPEKYFYQFGRAEVIPYLQIPETPFSTITFNRNFRTALHQDKGDYGFGNLSVVERGKYSGGYFVIPQYGVAIDMRSGDHLCVDVHQYHANTELYETPEQAEFNKTLSPLYNDSDVGVMGEKDKYTRISLVCYLRENIGKKCPLEKEDPAEIDRRSFAKNKLNYKYFINLDKDTHRLKKWKNSGFVRHRATHYEEMEACELFDKMISYWNISPRNHYGKCGCYHSHLSLLQNIVKYKMDMVLVCEDDAVQVKDFPTKWKRDGITYLGGFIKNKKITSNSEIKIKHKNGINELDKSKYRMMMTMSYVCPKWEIAEEILNKLLQKKRIRAWDIDLFNCLDKIYYEYPACYIEDDGISSIRGIKKKHSNEYYEWI